MLRAVADARRAADATGCQPPMSDRMAADTVRLSARRVDKSGQGCMQYIHARIGSDGRQHKARPGRVLDGRIGALD